MSPEGADQHGVDGRQRPLRVVDLTMFYGEQAGGIRTYLDAKQRWAQTQPAIEHTLIVPGFPERSAPGRIELPSVKVVATNGYRVPLGWRALRRVLRDRRPDVVIAHDPFWSARGLPQIAHQAGAKSVAVHHGAVGHDARSIPGPMALWTRLLSGEFRRVYRDFDAIMAAIDTVPEFGIESGIPLRFGVDPVFVPSERAEPRGDEVLYAGRMASAKCVDDLLRAAALSSEPWPLRLVGVGPARPRLRKLATELGLDGRVHFDDFIGDRRELAEQYRRAAAVVLPGRWETFGLAAYEAAACGASVVCCETAGSRAAIDGLAETFPLGPQGGPRSEGARVRATNLLEAIERARRAVPNQQRATTLAASSSWEHAFRAELTHLRALVGGDSSAAESVRGARR